MGRLDNDRKLALEPQRIAYAKARLKPLGIAEFEEDATTLKFSYMGVNVILFPFTGWHSGKGIQPGRGIDVLVKKLLKLQ